MCRCKIGQVPAKPVLPKAELGLPGERGIDDSGGSFGWLTLCAVPAGFSAEQVSHHHGTKVLPVVWPIFPNFISSISISI